jgi:hypothetical protein
MKREHLYLVRHPNRVLAAYAAAEHGGGRQLHEALAWLQRGERAALLAIAEKRLDQALRAIHEESPSELVARAYSARKVLSQAFETRDRRCRR